MSSAFDSWVLRLPGLRRHAETIRRLGSHLEKERARSNGLHAKLTALQNELAAYRRAIERERRMQLEPEMVARSLPLRHRALLASSRRGEAEARESAFSDVSAAYRDAIARGGPALCDEEAQRVDICGLTFWVPRDARHAGALADRLVTERQLPLDDIVSHRELGLGSVMLDIGGNIGTTSIPRVVAGDVACVYAAEPDPLNYACLVRNIRENGLGGFVMPDRVAISDRDGEAVLKRTRGMGNHYLVAGETRPAATDEISVPTLTVDRWMQRFHIEPQLVAFVKVDTQGWEGRVLDGARRLLACRHAAWIVEFSPGHLAKAGTPPARFIEQLQPHFTHFVDLRGEGPRMRKIGELAAATAYITERGERRYTDLVLCNAA